jgi:hypothetical protein
MSIEAEIVNKYKARLLALKARANLMPLHDWMHEALELLLQVRQEGIEQEKEALWEASN